MLHLVLSCLVSARADPPSPAGDTPATSPDPTPAALPGPGPSADATSFPAVLNDAKERYFQGEADRARELLQGLQIRLYAGEQPDWNLVVEALTYLGEIYYVQGNQAQAE